MIRHKKRTCLMAMLVIFLSVLFASLQTPSVGSAEVAGTSYPENRRVRSTFYESNGIIVLDRVAKVANTGEEIPAFRENPSVVNNRLHKEAEKAMRSEQRATWRRYVTEHRRSMADGGKNSRISSPNLLKDWRDAMRPVYFA